MPVSASRSSGSCSNGAGSSSVRRDAGSRSVNYSHCLEALSHRHLQSQAPALSWHTYQSSPSVPVPVTVIGRSQRQLTAAELLPARHASRHVTPPTLSTSRHRYCPRPASVPHCRHRPTSRPRSHRVGPRRFCVRRMEPRRFRHHRRWLTRRPRACKSRERASPSAVGRAPYCRLWRTLPAPLPATVISQF